MNRINSLLSAAAIVGLIAASPVLAASPAQDYIDHFSSQNVSTVQEGVSLSNPTEDYKASLKGEIAGYEAGHTAYTSAANPRQEFLAQLADHSVSPKGKVYVSVAQAE